MNVLFWFRKNTRALDRPGTVYCRVTVDKAEHNFATSVRVFKADWDAHGQKVRGRSDAAKVANQQLQQLGDGLREAFNILEREGTYITPEKVVLCYQKPQARKQSLLTVFGLYIAERQQLRDAGQLSQASLDADKVRLNLLELWLTEQGLQEMRPQELRAGKVEQFVQWLRANKRKRNYAMKVAQTFKSVLKWCVRKELLETNPMEGFEFKFDAPQQLVFLTPLELVRIWFYKFDNTTMRKVADLFLFQCFTGLAWQDLYNFRASEHLAPRPDGSLMLVLNRQKSGSTAMIPLLKPALEILHKYGGQQLPVPSNQFFNRTLKQIAYMLHLEKHLTTHVGRKTAGMILLQDGVSMTIVSRVLGHRSISITEKHYAHVLADTVTNEMSKVLGEGTLGITQSTRPFLTEFTEYLKNGNEGGEGLRLVS
ncbi:site-specific integrase [Hymenobacter sediminis]|uniref:site-specific integrase n=1 Tax=Hymenobacter sediminis TaxID=2218621 RepID=UPI00138FD1CB|nr:site-specific integrase [Hymenobacter sediminis]